MVRPLLVVEENCQLNTSATWSHVPTGGLVKKFTFCAKNHQGKMLWKHTHFLLSTQTDLQLHWVKIHLMQSLVPFHQRVLSYLWVVSEHVVPQDWSPGIWHLADVWYNYHRQGMGLQKHGVCNKKNNIHHPNVIYTWYCLSYILLAIKKKIDLKVNLILN